MRLLLATLLATLVVLPGAAGSPAAADDAMAEPAQRPRPAADRAASTGPSTTEDASDTWAGDPPALACRDFRRRPVRRVEVPFLGDAGRAEFFGGGPVIKVDPDIMRSLPPALQRFFELHECAHHALGHLFAPTLDSEKEADCWAMKEGVRRKVFVAADLDHWRPYLQNSRGSRMGHLPGPERLAFLAGCLEGAP